jgi:dUTP pyrophosphatase
MSQKVRIKLDEGAYMPERAHATDAGADIRTPEGFVLPAHGSAIVHTGVHIETPPTHATMIKSKSGLNVNHDITSEGVVDEGFSGEIIVKLYNHGPNPHIFERGDKITQIVIVKVMYAHFEEADEILAGERGSNGYGSTGR